MDYRFEYDDPYKILAHAIVAGSRASDVLRMLVDDEYILNCIVKEVRAQDFKGSFLDCIIECILTQKKRMEYMGHLDALAKYFFSRLDKERLRDEIGLVLAEAGIEIDR